MPGEDVFLFQTDSVLSFPSCLPVGKSRSFFCDAELNDDSSVSEVAKNKGQL